MTFTCFKEICDLFVFGRKWLNLIYTDFKLNYDNILRKNLIVCVNAVLEC